MRILNKKELRFYANFLDIVAKISRFLSYKTPFLTNFNDCLSLLNKKYDI